MIRIAVASGKGGTGKTLVATNLFYSLQVQGIDVKLIDCDAEEPNDAIFFNYQLRESIEVKQKIPVIDTNTCTFCGQCKEYCNYNAIFYFPISNLIYVIDDLCHDCGACIYACQYDAISEKDVLLGNVRLYYQNDKNLLVESQTKIGVYSSVPLIKAAVCQALHSEIVIFDSPPGTSCPFIHTVAHADYVILVTEPTPFGLSDLKQTVATLKTMNKQYGVLVNKSGLGNNEVYDYLQNERIPLLLELPFDEHIAYQYSNGELIVLTEKKWNEHFLLLYDNILNNYGNSCH